MARIARPPSERPLSPQQTLFVDEYLVDLNATQAAMRAGYSKRTAYSRGHKLLKMPNVAAAIQRRMRDRERRTEITQDWVLASLFETVERCKQAEPVRDRSGVQVFIETPDGQTAAAYTFDANGVLRGLELAGRHLGMFEHRHRHAFDTDADELTDEELEAIARRGRDDAAAASNGAADPSRLH